MAGYIGTQAVSVNTTSATISDDLAVGDDATIAGDATVTGVITGSTVEATGDTAAGDNAAMGYTAAEGLILTGQGSTSDITLKNDADATVFTVPTGTDDILFPDSAKAMFGAGSDLQIFHNGTDSVIQEVVNNRRFLIGGDEIAVRTGDLSEDMAKFIADGAVELYHNNAKKIETTSTGVAITGSLAGNDGPFIISNTSNGNNIDIKTTSSNSLVHAVKIHSAGNVEVKTGNLVIGVAGKGVDFSVQTATSASGASTVAEILDHYEDGSFTPAITDNSGRAGTQSIQVGRYIRVGRLVHVQGRVSISNLASMGGNIILIGLPFTSLNLSNCFSSLNIGQGANLNITAGFSVCGNFSTNSTAMEIQLYDATTGSTAMTTGEFSADGDIIFSGTYIAN